MDIRKDVIGVHNAIKIWHLHKLPHSPCWYVSGRPCPGNFANLRTYLEHLGFSGMSGVDQIFGTFLDEPSFCNKLDSKEFLDNPPEPVSPEGDDPTDFNLSKYLDDISIREYVARMRNAGYPSYPLVETPQDRPRQNNSEPVDDGSTTTDNNVRVAEALERIADALAEQSEAVHSVSEILEYIYTLLDRRLLRQ